MWRVVVLLLAVLLDIATADVKTGVHHELAKRLKRSAEVFECERSGPPPPPPGPPPPYWPPPPPPPFWRRHHHPPPWAYNQDYQQPNYQQDYQQQNYQQPKSQSYSNPEGSNSNTNTIEKTSPQSCVNCDGADSNAISNAKSETGQAVAVAIARVGPDH